MKTLSVEDEVEHKIFGRVSYNRGKLYLFGKCVLFHKLEQSLPICHSFFLQGIHIDSPLLLIQLFRLSVLQWGWIISLEKFKKFG